MKQGWNLAANQPGQSTHQMSEHFAELSEIYYPRDIEILGWCPAGSVLHHGEVSLWPWLATLLVMVSQ